MPASKARYQAHSKIPWRVRLNEMQTERASFDAHWREIDLFMAPGRFRDGHNAEENRGEKKHRKIIDETALRARRVFVAGFVSGMTSPARPWFKLTVADSDLAEFSSVRAWLEAVEQRINLVLARSNFYHAIANIYDDLGTFGTAALSVTERPDSIVWFRPHPVGDYYVSANDDMLVDTIYRETKLLVRQLVERFGRENCSTSTLSSYDAGNTEERVDVVQAIEPNDDRIPELQNFKNMPFRSVWFEESGEESKYLGQFGFEEFPSMVARWQASPLDDYGIDCPGMTALGGVKQL
ncbi:MAG: portal protein, partial [Pseudomonadota bacterium]